MARGGVAAARLVEVRVLDGPNIYFTRPAIKLTVDVGGWLKLPVDRVARQAGRAGLPDAHHPGEPSSSRRLRFVARLAGHLTRSLAEASGSRLAVRARPGAVGGELVIAFPWRRRKAAEALAAEVARLLARLPADRRQVRTLLREAAGRLDGVPPGPAPVVKDPAIPVVAVTGTNGKTTSVRLIAHVLRTAGWSVAFTSTDGVFRDGALVEEGDYSGFGGAARALEQPGIDGVVLEIARGGILLRGIGTTHNDVALVTNVSEDHLDQHGIATVDQLAEVKAAITRITRPAGWDVLNADDPRVLGMRHRARGRPFVFSIDPDHPAIRTTLVEHGRAMTLLDGDLVMIERRHRIHHVIRLEDVPVTLAGISTHNIRNALGAAAAAIALGLPLEVVARGLRTFVLDPEHNPGRANLFEADGRIVVVDYAHNEDGMRGLVEICRGLRRPSAQSWLAFGAAGDRTNAILHRLGYTAARGADHIAIAELHRYLRGRDPKDLLQRLLLGADDGGARHTPVFPDEIHALESMLAASRPDDVVAIAALGQRPEIFALLRQRNAQPIGPDRVRELVRRARPPA
ncbi:MAG TPA: Mur ligase family protein [Candidatus Limnocylindrales bacterium]|nr:Mur ligase family protein [Candidatus Limnocylindrales bacterium]